MYLGSSFFVLTQVLQYRCTVHPRLNAFNEDSNLNQGYMKPRIRRLKYKHLHLGTEMGDYLPAIELGEGRTARNLTVGASHTCVVLVRHPTTPARESSLQSTYPQKLTPPRCLMQLDAEGQQPKTPSHSSSSAYSPLSQRTKDHWSLLQGQLRKRTIQPCQWNDLDVDFGG